MATQNIPPSARMFDVGGLGYKFRAVGLVDKQAAQRAGLTLDEITSPYDLWNSIMPKNTYFVFGADSDRELRELESSLRFKQLSQDRRYERLLLFYNN